ncbi:hypothetical protein CXB51_003990 [Gossypium anomalum]|uniref:C3H1-type domain-containing protein n=1 Tax=Gossypium anomalum TaxID=47600 RepID=A0A8J6DAC8_9ROSI|nr:hypothetical protein CXB51_003990 [Gossypium anomalum]
MDDELKTKAMASNSTNVNPTKDIEASKTKEEGELSDSFDDETLDCSTAQSSGTIAPPLGPNSVPSAVKPIPPNLAGNAIAGNNIAGAVDVLSQQPIPPMSQKNVEKNQLPVKSTNRSWYAPSGGSNNLVIRFSDDDSGSDSEECSRQKPVENKSNSIRDGTQRPLTSSAPKLNKLGQTSTKTARAIPKKPLSRTFISSMTKINGGANPRVAVSSVDQGSQIRSFNPRNKSLACQDLLSEQGVVSNNSKLQDLRQQIALRESELKLKAAQQHKEIVLTSTMNLDNSGGRKWIATSAYGSVDPKEPDKKRLKLGDSNFTQSNSGAQPEVHHVKSNLVSKDQKLETKSLQSKDKVDHSKKVDPVSNTKSSIKWKRKDDKLVDVSLEDASKVVKDGVDMHKNLHQSKRTSREVDPSVLANQTVALTNTSASAMQNNLRYVELNHPTKVGLSNRRSSSPSKAVRELNLSKGNDYREVTSGDKTLDPRLSKRSQTSQDTASLWNGLGNVNIPGHSNVDVDIHSLVEIEEKLDKELEEAQKHRCLCEIEERNALKAYRKAQRALIEANARCTDLYRQRELCSARFRSLLVDDPCLLWSSRQHEHTRMGLDASDNVPENMDLVPISTHRLLPAYDSINRPGYDANIQCINIARHNLSLQHDNGRNLGSEPCSEQDASTSEPFPHNSNNAANGVRSPCSPIISADEDEGTSLMDHDSVQPSPEYQQKKQNSEVIHKSANNESNNQDSLLLEATLRSELFARLGMRTSKNIDSCYNEPSMERGAENDVESEKTQISNGSVTLSEAEKKHQFDVSGPEKPNEVMPEALVLQEKNNIPKFYASANPKDNGISVGCQFSATSIIFAPSSILRSAMGHLKAMAPVTRQRANHVYSEEVAYVNFDEMEQSGQIANSLEAICDLSRKGMGSYTCNIAIDPSWPLCMYELRGKCNNDECPFQHVKELSKRNTCMNGNDDSDSADSQLVLASCQQRSHGPTKPVKYNDVFFSPTYIVSLDILKADPLESVVPWANAHSWWKYFSICLALSSFFQKDLPTDEPFFHGDDGRIEVRGSWNRHSSYFQSRNGIAMFTFKYVLFKSQELFLWLYPVVLSWEKPVLSPRWSKAMPLDTPFMVCTQKKLSQSQASDAKAQSLEMALLILNQEVNKVEGMKKALSLLSRSLEADPASETLWMVYLLICYSRRLFVGKDDMFSFAVRNNEGSYELWLMYINSRKQLDDRLGAYDAALSALCRGSSSSGKGVLHMSACILDLFLQMMDCLCMSGNVEKAIQKIYRLFPATTNSEGPRSMFTDILACLTISDKCVLWVSCIYLVIYRKLPDAVVQRLEREKELLPVKWSSVDLGNNEKKKAMQLLEMVVSCVDSYISTELFKSESDLRSAQLFALNHIKCLVALNSTDCCQSMFEKYRKVYPSCLELVLISARVPKYDSENLSFLGFQEALNNWPKGSPGIHCIWNQYAEYAQQNGKADLAKELITCWYNSVWKVEYPETENLKPIDGGNSFVSWGTNSMSNSTIVVPNANQTDTMFGYLNLFLYNFLQNNNVDARSAIDQALRAATPMGFNHCVKEHALFLLNDESQKGDVPISWQINTLNMYLDTARSFQVSEPLSRHFITEIEKPRVQQLVRNILSPVSSDSSLVNLVLEVWHGPSLLPQNLTQPKDLVNFVEAILALVPSNYELMFSVCKVLSQGDCFRDVSPSLMFWASSTLVDAFFHAVPIAPEFVWVKAANVMDNVPGIETILTRFYRKALAVYPFSLTLWQSYHTLTDRTDDRNVTEEARERGIVLD